MYKLDFAALLHNVSFYKKQLGNSLLCAVVKNNAYGHGAEHVVRYLDDFADYFAVGSISEANKIAFSGKDILILLPMDYAEYRQAIEKGFVLTVDSFNTLHNVACVAARIRKKARVHIKVDSGMSRLGFNITDMEQLIDEIKSNAFLDVEGVCSHFYGDDKASCDSQYATFLDMAMPLQESLNKRLIKHIANSAGALLSPKYRLDMVRIGLGLYGYGDCNLQPVKASWAKVIAVRQVKSGDVVGYGAKYVASGNRTIAVIDSGYACGLSRSLVGSLANVNGTKCPVVAVCMAMTMIDVTSTAVKIGDEVKLLGADVDLSNDEVSIYELLCNLM